MPFTEMTPEDGTVEECLDELTQLLIRLGRFAPTVLAVSLRVHLELLLQALLEAGACTRAEVRAFVKELEREALQYEAD